MFEIWKTDLATDEETFLAQCEDENIAKIGKKWFEYNQRKAEEKGASKAVIWLYENLE